MAKVVERMFTGGAVFALPDSKLEVMWDGPGSYTLYIGSPRKAGGMTTTIRPDRYRLREDTLAEAKAAVDRFVADAEVEV